MTAICVLEQQRDDIIASITQQHKLTSQINDLSSSIFVGEKRITGSHGLSQQPSTNSKHTNCPSPCQAQPRKCGWICMCRFVEGRIIVLFTKYLFSMCGPSLTSVSKRPRPPNYLFKTLRSCTSHKTMILRPHLAHFAENNLRSGENSGLNCPQGGASIHLESKPTTEKT